jgi:hypothetical protein
MTNGNCELCEQLLYFGVLSFLVKTNQYINLIFLRRESVHELRSFYNLNLYKPLAFLRLESSHELRSFYDLNLYKALAFLRLESVQSPRIFTT